MGFGSEVEKHHLRGQHDLDRCIKLCFVRRIINAIYKVDFVTKKDLNPSGSTRGSNAAAQNPSTGPKVGRSANPSASPKFVFGNTKVKTRTNTVFGILGGIMVYKVQEPRTR